MKKILSLLLAVIMAFSIPCTAFAAEATPEGEIISTFIGEDGYEYEYIQYSEPVTYAYDGSTHTLLATIRRKPSDNNLTRDYHEFSPPLSAGNFLFPEGSCGMSCLLIHTDSERNNRNDTSNEVDDTHNLDSLWAFGNGHAHTHTYQRTPTSFIIFLVHQPMQG